MNKNMKSRALMNSGESIPWIGLGVWQGKRGDDIRVEQSIDAALSCGYRSIDTAAGYQNEKSVGRAVKASGIAREELFITTKVRHSDHGYDSTRRALEKSLNELDMDYVDLYLIHSPVEDKYLETWRALEKSYEEGIVRTIGVSNFQKEHLEKVIGTCKVVPAINQIELHPYKRQVELSGLCSDYGILVEAYSPFAVGTILSNSIVLELSRIHQKSPTQIILRWDLQHGIVTIPRSTKSDNIRENADIFDFELSDEDMNKLDGLDGLEDNHNVN